MSYRIILFVALISTMPIISNQPCLNAQGVINLTLDTALDIAMKRSFNIRILDMDVRSSERELQSRRARLKTQISMDVTSPELQNILDRKWNSNLGRDELIRQNSRLWQSELSIRQPIMLWNYPTNGYLSLNYQIYRYWQRNPAETTTDLYNRLYLKLEQPFFIPNQMKNNLEKAELDLRINQLEFIADQMNIIEDITEDYYDLVKLNYEEVVYRNHIMILDDILEIANVLSRTDSSYLTDVNQLSLELNNIEEKLMSNRSSFRAEVSAMKQQLRLDNIDSLIVDHEVELLPVNVELEQAIVYGLTNNPELQRLVVRKKNSEIDLANKKGDNAFHLSLEITYGIEKQDDHFRYLWEQFDNSNSISLNAYIPLWDGGERKYRIQSEELNILKHDLEIEQKKESITRKIRNSYTNMKEYHHRALNLKENVLLAEKIVQARRSDYFDGKATLSELIQAVQQLSSTEERFIEIYVDYKESLLDLMKETYYDFENNISVLEKIQH